MICRFYIYSFHYHIYVLIKKKNEEYTQNDSYNCGFFVLVNIGLVIATGYHLHPNSPKIFSEKYHNVIIDQREVNGIIPSMRKWHHSIMCNCRVQKKSLEVEATDDSRMIPNHTRISLPDTKQSISYASIKSVYKPIKVPDFPLKDNMKIPEINLATVMFLHEFDKTYKVFLQPLINEFPIYENATMYSDDPKYSLYHFIIYDRSFHKVPENDYYEHSDSDDEDRKRDDDDDDDKNSDSEECSNSDSSDDNTPNPQRQLFKITDEVRYFTQFNDKSLEGTHIPIGHRISSDFFLSNIFVKFMQDVSTLDLMNKEDMVKMDGLVKSLSVSSIGRHIGFHRYKKYSLFFKEGKLNEKQLKEEPIKIFKKFWEHYRETCDLRMGTILGTFNLLKRFRTFYQMKESPGTVSCIISNLDQTSMEGRSWNTQVKELQLYSNHDYYQGKINELFEQSQHATKIIHDDKRSKKSDIKTSSVNYIELNKGIVGVSNSTTKILGFPFDTNVALDKINFSLILLFHERSSDERHIMQPTINQRSINHGSQEFFSFYNQMKNGQFTDTSLFHFLVYRVNRLMLDNRMTLPQERQIVSIDVNTYTPKIIKSSESDSEFFSVERITNEFFHRFLVPFIHVVSSLDLFQKEDMIKMDKILSLDRSKIVHEYKVFFRNGTLSKKQKKVSSQKLFEEFCAHFRQYSVIRLGTIEGIHRLYSAFKIVKDSIVEENNPYIKGFHRCLITNLKEYSSEHEWKNQIDELQQFSRTYEERKSQIVTTSFVEIIDKLISYKFHNENNDIYIILSMNRKETPRYFNGVMYKICQTLKDYVKSEATRDIKNRKMGLQNLNTDSMNPIILEIWKSCPIINRNKTFWEWIDFDPILDMTQMRASSVNIKTIRFHYKSMGKGTIQQKLFCNLFGIQKSNSESNTKQSHVIRSFRNFMICINICQFTHKMIQQKLSQLRQSNEYRFFLENEAENEEDGSNNKIVVRYCDQILLGKFIYLFIIF